MGFLIVLLFSLCVVELHAQESILFCTADCGPCIVAKRALKAAGVKYVEGRGYMKVYPTLVVTENNIEIKRFEGSDEIINSLQNSAVPPTAEETTIDKALVSLPTVVIPPTPPTEQVVEVVRSVSSTSTPVNVEIIEEKPSMTRIRSPILASLVFSLMITTGCGEKDTGTPSTTTTTTTTTSTSTNNKPLILAAISTAAEIGTNQGLRALAKSRPAVANETATALKKSIDTVLLPYLKGGKIGTSEEVKILLNSSLFINVDPQIRDAIAAAAGILDAYLPIPGAGTVLNPDQIDYITAFVSGISRGCGDFLPQEPGRVNRNTQKPRWIELSAVETREFRSLPVLVETVP